jgi:hypothetical protein
VLTSQTITPADLEAKLRARGLTVDEIAEVLPSLEDVFLDVVERTAS